MLSEIKTVSIAGDMAAGLRHIADLIEAGERPDARFTVTVVVDKDNSVDIWAHGNCSALEIVGALAKAAARDLR
jgi:hypothetical protein